MTAYSLSLIKCHQVVYEKQLFKLYTFKILRSGRPLDATDEEMALTKKCKKVRDLVYSDRRIQEE